MSNANKFSLTLTRTFVRTIITSVQFVSFQITPTKVSRLLQTPQM
jgi:hypothetical protein